MTLEEVVGRPVPRETEQRLRRFAALLTEENARQNLVSQATVADLWSRHILDGAQLVPLLKGDSLLDIGTGPGLPGMVLAILTPGPVTLLEPRRLRVEFLARAVEELGLPNVRIIQGKTDKLAETFDTITARAVAPAAQLFALAAHLTHAGTRFVLPKGRSAQSELAQANRTWQGVFRLERSLTSDEAAILVADRVRRRNKA